MKMRDLGGWPNRVEKEARQRLDSHCAEFPAIQAIEHIGIQTVIG